MKKGYELIKEERIEQIKKHRYNETEDEVYMSGELIDAAIAYLEAARYENRECPSIPNIWPWHTSAFKPSSIIKCLMKAGAFCAAEIDRINLEEINKLKDN